MKYATSLIALALNWKLITVAVADDDLSNLFSWYRNLEVSFLSLQIDHHPVLIYFHPHILTERRNLFCRFPRGYIRRPRGFSREDCQFACHFVAYALNHPGEQWFLSIRKFVNYGQNCKKVYGSFHFIWRSRLRGANHCQESHRCPIQNALRGRPPFRRCEAILTAHSSTAPAPLPLTCPRSSRPSTQTAAKRFSAMCTSGAARKG